ncbi:MAG: tyrosine-type recombinase/integrase [Catenulispora sp.]
MVGHQHASTVAERRALGRQARIAYVFPGVFPRDPKRHPRVSTFTPAERYLFSADPDGANTLFLGSVTQRYKRLAILLGLSSHQLHSLRHYTATELIAAGVDIRTVAGRLGHGSGGATTVAGQVHPHLARLELAGPLHNGPGARGVAPGRLRPRSCYGLAVARATPIFRTEVLGISEGGPAAGSLFALGHEVRQPPASHAPGPRP